MDDVVFRDLDYGDMGLITQKHAVLYRQEFGWDRSFEPAVAELMVYFGQTADHSRERAWVAEIEGRFAGCVFLFQENPQTSRLRMLLVEPWARGRGLGKQLVDLCIDYSRQKGYQKMMLLTFDVLYKARSIYLSRGMTMVKNEPTTMWGNQLSAEYWEMPL